ncbi:MAG: twin-arginine translocase TatA/TatE family subunit [Thermoleophilaceae bacterium]|nr:twin-arginine translocase TatA/TatE family subunit [Thermoleophilaceae bacterium]
MSVISLIGPIGPLEIGIILLIVLVIFGPKRLPELGKSLGGGMRNFKDSVTGKDDDEDESPQIEATSTTAVPTEQREATPVERSGDQS